MSGVLTTARPAGEIEAAPSISETGAVLSMIERLARDPTVDIDRIERMMAVHRDLRREQAEREFNAAMVAVQASLPRIKRDAANKETHSTYARLETISAAVDPIVAEHGMSLSYGTEVSPLKDHYRVVCDVRHGSHKERYFVDIPIDDAGPKGTKNKSDTHAFGSTISYARRYLKLMIFDISLVNEDNDGNRRIAPREAEQRSQLPRSAPAKPPRQANTPGEPLISTAELLDLRDLLASTQVPERAFLSAYQLKALSDLPKARLSDAIADIEAEGAKRGR